MKKRLILISYLLIFLSCSNKITDEGPKIIAELAAKIPSNIKPTRGYRNCELFDLSIEGNKVVMNVWNNVAQGHNCPDEWLTSIDRELYLVDGPRWQPIDYAFSVDKDLNLIRDDSQMMEGNSIVREIPKGGGINMVRAATVDIGNKKILAKKFDIEIDGSESSLAQLRKALFTEITKRTIYNITKVNREFRTFWVYKAGKPVYVMSDGECEYAMKYFTSSKNPTLINEDAIKNLNNSFKNLPEGFSFEVRLFEEDVYILDLNGLQYVLTDEFDNSYDRLWCGKSKVPYTIMKEPSK